jgi:hypothetical protein
MTVQNLGRWVANNWRPYATIKASKSLLYTSRTQVVLQTCKDEVQSEIQNIIQEKGLLPSADSEFQCRTSAARRVFNRMDEEKKQEILRMVQEYKTKGNDPQIQHQ